ncbi:MAG: hypothetical protein A4E20_12065 [Nitrospira sp. SG-bin2]|uniref:hypothetical protein n=1 Tax=Nitrospira cf. moscoviensis SBR1015 TaxID=96242 RepID=UPI000A0E00C1|nr:hypothetical protein [Nitrospira cf. moscoviensis SBR1015]OQW33958.1 MAG: hypothetical protein A4E20_12065 [Nitrospira sp. SG-bin2]
MASAVSKEWKALNDQLREADEPVCRQLLEKELTGSCRQRYLLRIHSRLNYVRAHAERDALTRGEAI